MFRVCRCVYSTGVLLHFLIRRSQHSPGDRRSLHPFRPEMTIGTHRVTGPSRDGPTPRLVPGGPMKRSFGNMPTDPGWIIGGVPEMHTFTETRTPQANWRATIRFFSSISCWIAISFRVPTSRMKLSRAPPMSGTLTLTGLPSIPGIRKVLGCRPISSGVG
jgi:hypothetical protein